MNSRPNILLDLVLSRNRAKPILKWICLSLAIALFYTTKKFNEHAQVPYSTNQQARENFENHGSSYLPQNLKFFNLHLGGRGPPESDSPNNLERRSPQTPGETLAGLSKEPLSMGSSQTCDFFSPKRRLACGPSFLLQAAFFSSIFLQFLSPDVMLTTSSSL
jgi:hypothetical protein